MREINHNARLKGVNQKFETAPIRNPRSWANEIFQKKRGLSASVSFLSHPLSPNFSFFALALFLARPETGNAGYGFADIVMSFTLGARDFSCAVSGFGQAFISDPREKPLDRSATPLMAPNQSQTR